MLLVHPPPWPDESIYADIAGSILHQGSASTSLWQGLVPGVQNQALWYPQPFFYLVSWWYRFTGVSFVSTRLLASVFTLGLFCLFALITRKSTWSLLALSVDYLFIKDSRLLRPETLVLFLLMLVFILNRVYWSTFRPSYLFVLGFILSSIVLIHPLAFLFVLVYFVWLLVSKPKAKMLIYFILGLLLPLFLWYINIWPNLSLLLEQSALMAQRKSLEISWLQDLIRSADWAHLLLLLSYVCLLIIAIRSKLKNASKHNEFALLLGWLLAAWLIALIGKMSWYFIYIPLFSYLIAGLKILKKQTRPILIIASSISLLMQITTLTQASRTGFNFGKYTQMLMLYIPDKTTVFLSSVPDPYFSFLASSRQNQLIEFPTMPLNPSQYLSVLNQCDYIIYTDSYDRLLFGSLLTDYINRNQSTVTLIGKATNYESKIIKLKPRDQRN